MSKVIEARLDASSKKFAIVASRWNEHITKLLVEGAQRALRMHGGGEADVIWVSGSWEIPIAALKAIRSDYDAVICVGCILQGATIHATQLSNNVCSALADIMIKCEKPLTWGIITADTQEEALERAGMKLGNKGEEAARAAIEMCDVLNKVGQ